MAMRWRWLSLILLIWLSSATLEAATLNDFEDGDEYNNTGSGYLYKYQNDRTHGNDPQKLTIITTGGANGTDGCASIEILGNEDPETGNGNCFIDPYYYGNLYVYERGGEMKGTRFVAASECDRLSFWIKIPPEYPQMTSYNFHLGTYSLDPGNPDQYQDGMHWYHWFNIPGSNYWTKCIANSHPQHRVGDPTDQSNNPCDWDYVPNLTKFYIDFFRCSPIGGYTAYLDEFIFYTPPEPENDVNVASISCSYFGQGRFVVIWRGNGEYTTFNHTYDVYWSTSPITNANYLSANKVQTGPFSRQETTAINSWFMADCTISVTEGTAYFAIKDLDDESTVVSKIDYQITAGETLEDPLTPSVTITTSPQTVSISSVSISFTASDNIGVTSCKWRIGSAPDATHGTDCISPATVTGLSVGQNTVYIGAGDAAGNWGSDSITVNYSPVATTISIINSGIRGGGGVR